MIAPLRTTRFEVVIAVLECWGEESRESYLAEFKEGTVAKKFHCPRKDVALREFSQGECVGELGLGVVSESRATSQL